VNRQNDMFLILNLASHCLIIPPSPLPSVPPSLRPSLPSQPTWILLCSGVALESAQASKTAFCFFHSLMGLVRQAAVSTAACKWMGAGEGEGDEFVSEWK